MEGLIFRILRYVIALRWSKVSFKGQKMPESCPDWSPSMLSPWSCCLPISQQQQSCHIGKREDAAGDEVGSPLEYGVI